MRNFILLPLLCLSVFATAQTLKDTVARLDSFFAAHSVGDSTPGGVLMISRNGQILYKKYMGLASLEHKTPITENTVFEAASVSKQFTATSILLLAREGRISLDDDVRKYIPQLPDYGETIRIHHLLTHTSGLKDWRNITYISGWPTGKRLYNQSMALDMICKQKSLNFMPGERYSYSNSGYDLLAVIVEKVSGMKFKDFVGERLLKLAGMNQSFFRPAHEQIIPHMASSYIQQNDQSYIHPLILDESYGAAGLITNATDLHKWVLFIEKGGLSEDIKKLRSTRFVLNNGDTITYALGGVHVMHRDNLIEINHSGLLAGFRAWTAYYPQSGLTVSYTSNNRNVITADMAKVIRNIFFGTNEVLGSNSPNVKQDTSYLKSISALYRGVTDNSWWIDVQYRNGVILHGNDTLKPISPAIFTNGTYRYKFEDGYLNLITAETDDKYKRAERFHPDQQHLASFEGEYYSDDADLAFSIKLIGDRLYSYRTSYDSVPLVPVYSDAEMTGFRTIHNGLRAVYHFEKDKDGSVIRLSVSLPRANNIPFRKN